MPKSEDSRTSRRSLLFRGGLASAANRPGTEAGEARNPFGIVSAPEAAGPTRTNQIGVEFGAFMWEIPTRMNATKDIRAATVDGRRRVVLPPVCPPGSAVTIELLDANTYLIRRRHRDKRSAPVLLPDVEHLSDDPEWEAFEIKVAAAMQRQLPEPEE